MRICVNGTVRDATVEELAAAKSARTKQLLEDRSRPMSESDVIKVMIAQQINDLDVGDDTSYRMRDFYPDWAADTAYTIGFKVKRSGRLWRAIQAHTSQAGWEPENAPSLWTEITETYTGTEDDPIPYNGNMALENGKYYVQDYVIYLCSRDTGDPVYHALSELVGLYVETT